jgi:ribonucleoside-diphosphate reductase alpha chain
MQYSPEEVKKANQKKYHGDELAVSVIMNKYLNINDQGEFLEIDHKDMLSNRIAPEFARIERNYENPLSEEEIYAALEDFKYIIPQGSPLYGQHES